MENIFYEYNSLKNKVLSKNTTNKQSKINTDEVFGMCKDDFSDNESSEDIQRRWRKEQCR